MIQSDRTSRSSRGEVIRVDYDAAERRLRGLQRGGIAWALAFACIFLPLVHFVLVPGFILAGPLVLFFYVNTPALIESGSGSCPDCGEVLEIAKTQAKFPLKDQCEHCQTPIKVFLSQTAP